MSEYARFHWLASPAEVKPELLGDFYLIRAGAADAMGMTDEAVAALRDLVDWGKSTDDHAIALIANAHLAFQALDQDSPSVYPLRPAEDLLRELLGDFYGWRPDPDSLTIAEDSGITGESVPRSVASKLATAATTAYSAAVNISQDLAEEFATLVRRFGMTYPTEADRKLWFAQQHWFAGRHDEARALALDAATADSSSPTARFDARDMLGHFALLDEDQSGIAEHWRHCVDIAERMGASVIAMKHAELTSRVYFADGRQGEAWLLASTMLEKISGVPMGPTLLDLQEVVAQSALDKGLDQEAWDTARSVVQWSEMSPNDQRTSSCYAIATFAGLRLGLQEEVFDMQHRRAELLEQSGRLIEAAEVMQALAFLDTGAATVYMKKAWELINAADEDEEELTWQIAEWHLSMAQLAAEHLEHAERAAEMFAELGNPIKEAFAWLAAAQSNLAMGEMDQARADFAQANLAMPESDGRSDELDQLFDHVREQLD